MRHFLGVDVGNTKSHALIADETGRATGFGTAGMGSWEGLGWDGAQSVLHEMAALAFAQAGIVPADISGAGFGYAGYDWPEDRPGHERIIGSLGLVNAAWDVGNDVVIGLFAGAEAGWGVVVSAGTSNNCHGRDRHGRTCQMTGAGATFGEYGGAVEVVGKALQAVSLAWSRRGPATALSDAFVAQAGASDVDDLFAGLIRGRYELRPAHAPLVFDVAAAGDPVAAQIICWAGRELGGLALGAIRQLDLTDEFFDVVLSGSLFRGSPRLKEVLGETIHEVAPGARLVRLEAPPVVGGVLWGMRLAGVEAAEIRALLFESARGVMADGR